MTDLTPDVANRVKRDSTRLLPDGPAEIGYVATVVSKNPTKAQWVQPPDKEIMVGNGDPNGVHYAPKSTPYIERDASPPSLWLNDDGAAAWHEVGASGGSGFPITYDDGTYTYEITAASGQLDILAWKNSAPTITNLFEFDMSGSPQGDLNLRVRNDLNMRVWNDWNVSHGTGGDTNNDWNVGFDHDINFSAGRNIILQALVPFLKVNYVAGSVNEAFLTVGSHGTVGVDALTWSAKSFYVNAIQMLFQQVKVATASADLAASDFGMWLDDTPGATKIMFKAKDSSGTVVTGSVALT